MNKRRGSRGRRCCVYCTFLSPWHLIPPLLPYSPSVVHHEFRLYFQEENGKWKTGRDLTRFLSSFCFGGGKIIFEFLRLVCSFLNNFVKRIYNFSIISLRRIVIILLYLILYSRAEKKESLESCFKSKTSTSWEDVRFIFVCLHQSWIINSAFFIYPAFILSA